MIKKSNIKSPGSSTDNYSRITNKTYFFGVILIFLIFPFGLAMVNILVTMLFIFLGIDQSNLVVGIYNLLLTLLALMGIIYFCVAMLILPAKRLHDLDKSAWWLLLYLVPFVSFPFMIWLFVSSGNKGENRFGAQPKPRKLIDDLFFKLLRFN